MTEQKNDDIINFLCANIFEIQGKLKASNLILHSLLSTVCESAPQLIDDLKTQISEKSDLAYSLKEVSHDLEGEIFDQEIKQCLLRFDLIEEGAKYARVKIVTEN